MRNQRINLTISNEFALELRRYVPARQRSQFMESAARDKLRMIRQAEALRAAAGSWKAADHPDVIKEGVDKWLGRSRASWSARTDKAGKKP